MTKEERKARRIEKKMERRESRKLRKIKAKAFKAAMANNKINIDIDNKPGFVEVFNQFWPLAKPAFEFVVTLRITKDKADVVLNTIIDLGDRISNGEASAEEETEFIGLLISVWSGVKMGLEILQIVTGKKADDIIDNIIETGEYILGDENLS
jgi:hypothetical protein